MAEIINEIDYFSMFSRFVFIFLIVLIVIAFFVRSLKKRQQQLNRIEEKLNQQIETNTRMKSEK